MAWQSPQLCYKVQEDRSIASSDDVPSVDTTHGAWWVHRASVLGHREWVSIQWLLGSPGTTNNAPLIPAKVRDHRKIKQKNGKPECWLDGWQSLKEGWNMSVKNEAPPPILNSVGSLHNCGQQARTASPYGERAKSCGRNSGCCVNETLTMGREPQRKRCFPLVRFLSYIIFCPRIDILQIILIRHLITS